MGHLDHQRGDVWAESRLRPVRATAKLRWLSSCCGGLMVAGLVARLPGRRLKLQCSIARSGIGPRGVDRSHEMESKVNPRASTCR